MYQAIRDNMGDEEAMRLDIRDLGEEEEILNRYTGLLGDMPDEDLFELLEQTPVDGIEMYTATEFMFTPARIQEQSGRLRKRLMKKWNS